MTSFDARLEIPGHTRRPVRVIADITDETLTVTAGQRQLGAWPVRSLKFSQQSDGFHGRLDDQDVILSVDDSTRFALELGSSGQQRSRSGIAKRLATISPDQLFEELKRRVTEVAEAMSDDIVIPDPAFGEWLRLLKEINVRHGQGSMPTSLFYRLNTELLDLIPVARQERQLV